MDYLLNFEKITDEEFELRMEKYRTDMKKLYDIMPTLTHEEYREKYKETFNIILNLGQHIVSPNTRWIEEREFEVFGKRWSDYCFLSENEE